MFWNTHRCTVRTQYYLILERAPLIVIDDGKGQSKVKVGDIKKGDTDQLKGELCTVVNLCTAPMGSTRDNYVRIITGKSLSSGKILEDSLKMYMTVPTS